MELSPLPAEARRLDPQDVKAADAFIRANTKLIAPPLVPEIRLHLAEESLPIWRKTEEELGEINVPPPYWAFAWAGGQALARYILDNPEAVTGRAVLDLGSGSGMTAIAAKLAGAGPVLAADIDGIAIAALRLNAEVNRVEIEATQADVLASKPAKFDVVLVGDLFYERQLAERVLAFVEAAAANRRLGAHRRSQAQLLSSRPVHAGRRIPGSGDAGARGRGDQAHGRLAALRAISGRSRTCLAFAGRKGYFPSHIPCASVRRNSSVGRARHS